MLNNSKYKCYICLIIFVFLLEIVTYILYITMDCIFVIILNNNNNETLNAKNKLRC